MHKNKALIAPLGLVSITILSGVFLMSSYSYATSDNTDIVDEINITVPISCTMSGTGMTSHTANMSNGSYTPNIGTTTLKVFCNDTEGFAIFAAGYTGDEIGGTNSTKLVNSASQVNNTISTGTATSGNTSNWAMKLATNASATYAVTLDNGFGAYSAVPSSYTKVAHRDSGTDIGTTATGAELTTTYAAFVNQTQPAGTYVGKVIYTLVHPSNETPTQPVTCDPGKICYNPNTATALGEMAKQSAGNSAEVNLYASNFSRTGYGFAGWNTAYDYSGTTYGPNETITTPSDTSTNGLSLYAVWVPSAGTLQNWNGCSGLAQGAVTALTDARDNDTYAVAKLADGKCWMIENLRLDNTAEHNTDGSLAQGYNSSFVGLAAPESANFSNSTTANPLYSIDGTTDATISGSYQGYRFPRYNNDNTHSRQSGINYFRNGNTYSYGNYYTWHAAIADITHYNTDNQSIVSTSLCPAGWHLPRGGDKSNEANNEFWTLIVTEINNGVNPANYNSSTYPYYDGTEATPLSNTLRSYPNNFLYSGYFSGTTATRGTNGYYWTSTTNDDMNSYIMYLYRTNVNPGDACSIKKSTGKTVRCILNS